MPAEINYRKKYLELRSKYIADLDVAFRLGFEAGGQQAQQQQALDAQQQAQQMEHEQSLAETGGIQPGQEGQQPGSEQPGQPDEGQPKPPGAEGAGGSELDQHIGKLESMLGSGSEPKPENGPEIQKSLNAIISLRKAEKFALEMKKSEQAITGIAKALHKPSFKLGTQAQHNLTDNAKKTLSAQHKMVNDIFKSWKEQEAKASHDISAILDIEHLVKE